MATADWRSKVILNAGETLRHDGSTIEGFMQETDVDVYSIVNADGSVTGSLRVTDHTAVKGFKAYRSYSSEGYQWKNHCR